MNILLNVTDNGVIFMIYARIVVLHVKQVEEGWWTTFVNGKLLLIKHNVYRNYFTYVLLVYLLI